jgi:hypothetical protein
MALEPLPSALTTTGDLLGRRRSEATRAVYTIDITHTDHADHAGDAGNREPECGNREPESGNLIPGAGKTSTGMDIVVVGVHVR